MSWQTNFKDTAHYVPLTGEIRASKIQGEGRGYPDSVSGDADYVGNPTGIAKPEEMRMDDMRYRRMVFPDGRYPFQDFVVSPFSGGQGNSKGATIQGGFGYPEVATESLRGGSLFNPIYNSREDNPFRGISWGITYGTDGPNGQGRYTWRAVSTGKTVPPTQIQYRARRLNDIQNNLSGYRNQIKYSRGLNRTDTDWRPSFSIGGDYGYGYTVNQTGHSNSGAIDNRGLDQTNSNGDGPFNTPITKAGEIKFSDFRGKNKFYKTDFRIGKNDYIGSSNFNSSPSAHYPPNNSGWNSTVNGNYISSIGGTSAGNLEFVAIYGTMQNSSAPGGTYGDAVNPDGSRGYARGYVNPDFSEKLSASGITLPASRGAMQHVSTMLTSAFTNITNSKFKPIFASKSISEPKNSATIGRYDSVTRSMPTYDYVNQGTGSTNRPPIVSNPRDGEMTHCIWYKPNTTGTGAWDGGDITLPSTWDTSAFSGSTTPRRGAHVIEIGILGRHYHTNRLLDTIYWDTGYRSGNMGNTGNSADYARGGGQFIDGTNVVAQLEVDAGEIFYASPSADNLYFGQTVWRCAFRVYDPNSQKTPPAGWNSFGDVPFDWPAYLGTANVTRVIFASSTGGAFYGGTPNHYQHLPELVGVDI